MEYIGIVDRVEKGFLFFRHPLIFPCSVCISRISSRKPINSKQFAILEAIRPREQAEFLDVWSGL